MHEHGRAHAPALTYNTSLKVPHGFKNMGNHPYPNPRVEYKMYAPYVRFDTFGFAFLQVFLAISGEDWTTGMAVSYTRTIAHSTHCQRFSCTPSYTPANANAVNLGTRGLLRRSSATCRHIFLPCDCNSWAILYHELCARRPSRKCYQP